MDDLLTLGTLSPERGLAIVGLVLNEHVITGDFSLAVRAPAEARWILRGRGHGGFSRCPKGMCDTESRVRLSTKT